MHNMAPKALRTAKDGETSKYAIDMKSSTSAKAQKSSVTVQTTKSSKSVKETLNKAKPVERSTSRSRKNKSSKKNEKRTVRWKKVSATTISKWQKLPQSLQDTIMSMLEDAISPFTVSGNDDVEDELDVIRVRVKNALQKIKAPKEKSTDMKSLKNAQKVLSAEKTRLEELKTNLEEEMKQLEQLETENSLSENTPGENNEQVHVILQG